MTGYIYIAMRKGMNTEKLKTEFEKWYFKQFGNGAALKFITIGEDSGYENTHVNCLWIGFCAGRLTA